jgi:predicted small metal-binding protein
VVTGADDDEFVANVTEHAKAEHPEMVPGLTREAILGMAQG